MEKGKRKTAQQYDRETTALNETFGAADLIRRDHERMVLRLDQGIRYDYTVTTGQDGKATRIPYKLDGSEVRDGAGRLWRVVNLGADGQIQRRMELPEHYEPPASKGAEYWNLSQNIDNGENDE